MRQWTGLALIQVMAWLLFGAWPLQESMLIYCQLDHCKQILVKFASKCKTLHSENSFENTVCELEAISSRGRWVNNKSPLFYLMVWRWVGPITKDDLVHWHLHVQYIPRNMNTVFTLLCFVLVIHWLIFPYPSGLLHWHCGNLTIAPVPAKQPWWIWINTSCEFIMNDCITTTKQNTTKPCAYFLGYAVSAVLGVVCNIWYPSETHLKPRSREISFARNFFISAIQSFWRALCKMSKLY